MRQFLVRGQSGWSTHEAFIAGAVSSGASKMASVGIRIVLHVDLEVAAIVDPFDCQFKARA